MSEHLKVSLDDFIKSEKKDKSKKTPTRARG